MTEHRHAYHLNMGRAPMRKQMAFRRDRQALRRIDGDAIFHDKIYLVWCKLLVSGSKSHLPGRGFMTIQFFFERLCFQADKGVQGEKKKASILRCLQLKMIFMPQWHILDLITAI